MQKEEDPKNLEILEFLNDAKLEEGHKEVKKVTEEKMLQLSKTQICLGEKNSNEKLSN